ncbi:hypothetical protein FLX08_14790 [Microbispora hainanensis]|uniref:Uncharacterized protein n=1 Tax=Microbispora hainanensis TaxID=568844 RepID=A0A544YVF5_9ACTN|nr:hypothetical protein FLX08_14790 [Microbispora hainanensis]
MRRRTCAAVGGDAADDQPSAAGGTDGLGEGRIEEGVEGRRALDHRPVADDLQQLRIERARGLGRLTVGHHQAAAVCGGGPGEKRVRDPEARRAAILAAARSVFAERGDGSRAALMRPAAPSTCRETREDMIRPLLRTLREKG